MDVLQTSASISKESQSEVGDQPWPAPQPIKSTLPAVDKFIPELLPDVIATYVMDVADGQQAPADFVAVAAMCGIAAVIGNRFRIRPKEHDDWEIVPNLWGAIVGRPSAMKTPAMQAALAPLYAIQNDLRKTWEQNAEISTPNCIHFRIPRWQTQNRTAHFLAYGTRMSSHRGRCCSKDTECTAWARQKYSRVRSYSYRSHRYSLLSRHASAAR